MIRSAKYITLMLITTLFSGAVFSQTKLVILGTLQDGGSPHIGCNRDCCKQADATKKVVSIGLLDASTQKKYLFEATPDITSQLKEFQTIVPGSNYLPDGIFLTHAHIGHYTRLMFLGREAMNSKQVPVYAMATLKKYLETNGPWSQLVGLQNIQLQEMQDRQENKLSATVSVTPLRVPHRDEFSETVGFIIKGPEKTALFIPDIDKWSKWNHRIQDMIAQVDYALIDATFFNNAEVGYRNVAEIPHPLVEESMQLLNELSAEEKKKVFFIHLNHTNPLLNKKSTQRQLLESNGFSVAEKGQVILL